MENAYDGDPRNTEESGLDNLAGRLFGLIADIPGNTVASPSCLFQTLSLAAEATAGETKSQIIEALGGETEILAALASTSRIDYDEYMSPNFAYSTGTSIWMDASLRTNDPVKAAESLPLACAVERVEMGSPEAKRRMGEWLQANTGGIFSEAPDMSRNTALALMGALHLKDAWRTRFEEDYPRLFHPGSGNSMRVDFMVASDAFNILESDGSVTLSKPLTSGCRMYASLPPADSTLSGYIRSGAAWNNIISNIHGASTERFRECEVRMPRFELTSEDIRLDGLIRKMGITGIFASNADFTPISPHPLSVGEVVQSTELRIDEEGLEGASHTEMIVVTGLPPENPPAPREIIFDRPFAVAVTSPSGSPLFVGTVEMSSEEHRTSRTLGDVVYGAAIGDALGVPFEFRKRGTFECMGMEGGGFHGMPEGTFSDDTSLLLATCDSIRECGGIDTKDMRQRFVSWLHEGAYTPDGRVFDVGNSTATALEQGFGCNGERSNGNGSLMRIAPLALTDATDDEIRAVSAITHAHPLSMDACVIFVHVLRGLLAGEAMEDALARAVPDDGRFAFLKDIPGTPRHEIRSTGYVLDTLGAAIWCACHTESYTGCVLEAVNLGDDSDTTACVAGALAGAIYGRESIPPIWQKQLRGKELIEACLF